MSPSCDVAVLAVGDGLVSSNSRSEPLSMVVVSGRRLLRSCTLVRLVALAGPAGLVGLAELVALVAGQSESKTPGTIVEAAGSSCWVSGCSLVRCTCMMARTV